MIDDADIEKALEWLVRNAEKSAQARANRVLLEETTRSIKAEQMKASGQDSIGAQEREAYASDAYKAHVTGLAAAVYEDEKLRALRAAAEAKLSAWQTLSANSRAQGKVT
jgi:hypothetical protein